MANGDDDIRLGTALLYLVSEWKLSAADAWIILNPHSRATSRNSAGAQGRRMRKWRRTRPPLYCCRDGYELLTDLPIIVLLVELHKLRRDTVEREALSRKADDRINQALDNGNLHQAARVASCAHRDRGHPSYTHKLERIRMGLNLTVLEKLHGMTRARAWGALRPQSKAVGASAAAQAQRAIREYRELEAMALDLLREPEPSSPELSSPELSWLSPLQPPDLLWYARLLTEPHPLQQQIEKRLAREKAMESFPVDPNAYAYEQPSPSVAPDTPAAQVVEPQVVAWQVPGRRKWDPYEAAKRNRWNPYDR